MANLLHLKASRTKVLKTLPSNNFGKDGDIVLSKTPKGNFLCTKIDGQWFAASELRALSRISKPKIKDLKVKNINITNMLNTNNDLDKFVVLENKKLKYKDSKQLLNSLSSDGLSVNYKTAYCSLGQYDNKEDCWANGGTWYYSENDSHDSLSNVAENELLTVGSSIGKVDAESTLTYDGSTLEIKYNPDFDDNWQTSTQDKLLKLTYDSSNFGSIGMISTGTMSFIVEEGNSFAFYEKQANGTASARMVINADEGILRLNNPANVLDAFSIDVDDNAVTTISTIDFGSAVGHLTLDIDGDIILDANSGITKFYLAGDTDDLCTLTVAANGATTIVTADSDGVVGHLALKPDGDLFFQAKTGIAKFLAEGNDDDYAELRIDANGGLIINTFDNAGSNADITINADGDIQINSFTGNFIASKGGTEFSPANSAYSGMLLGYTDIGLDEATATYNLTTAYVVPTSEFKVTFVAPPSGQVEIEIQVMFDVGSSNVGDLYAGLSDNASYNASRTYHEVELFDAMSRGAIRVIRHSWTEVGFTAGTSYDRWVGFKTSNTSGTPHLQWGGNSADEFPDFIMKATALPATIST